MEVQAKRSGAGVSVIAISVRMRLATESISATLLRADSRQTIVWRSLTTALLPRPHLVHPRRPAARDVCEYVPYLFISQARPESGHVALVTSRGVRGHQADLGDSEQHVVGVVPCVSCFVVRRSRQSAIRHSLAPVRLSLEIHAVARRAGLLVNNLAGSDLRGVRRVDSHAVFAAACTRDCQDNERRRKYEKIGTHAQPLTYHCSHVRPSTLRKQ